MRVESYIRLLGIILGIGILDSYSTLNNGVLFISDGRFVPVMFGITEILRWSLGLLAAILLLRVRRTAQWVLLAAFLCGLVASWVSFIPFAGYLIFLTDETSVIQNFIALQIPNLILVLMVFYLFRALKKSNNEGTSVAE